MCSATRIRHGASRALAAAILAACGAAAVLPGAARAQSSPAPPTVLDGPSANIVGLSGISVARDGTGGVVYLKDVGGVQHVFVSRLAGSFQSPQRVDAGLSSASSQPVIAAGNGGLLLVAFINGGQLYVVDRASTSSAFTSPAVLATGASNPAIAITNLSKAYLAFTAADGSGHDVRCAYYYRGSWGVEPGSFNATPRDDAGTGTGRPAVAAAGDGVGIVVWGEGGHIYTRRVWGIPPGGTGPSIAYEQADIPSLNGWNEVSASDPVIGSGGDSSYVAVAFDEVFANGSQQQSRVLMRQLRGGIYDILAQPDGLTPGGGGADDPQVTAGEYGEGFVTSARATSNELMEMRLSNNETPGAVSELDSLPNTSQPFAAPTSAGLHSALIAWQEQLAGANPQIRARFFDGTSFGPEQVLSSPNMGPTDAADGLLTDGDGAADAVAAWVQGQAGSRAIVVAQLYQPPGSFGPLKKSRYARSVEPKLSWSASRELWGPLRYVVTLDGVQVGQTTGTSLQLPTAQFPTPLSQGRHTWQVTAVNPAGVARTDNTASVFVDTIAPSVLNVRLTGKRTPGSPVRIRIRATDAVGIPAADASGIKSVRVRWGDGISTLVKHGSKFHVYKRVGRYRITVIVTDRAGNTTTQVVKIRIKHPPKPKRRKGRHGHR